MPFQVSWKIEVALCNDFFLPRTTHMRPVLMSQRMDSMSPLRWSVRPMKSRRKSSSPSLMSVKLETVVSYQLMVITSRSLVSEYCHIRFALEKGKKRE